ncbi:MAG: hypothetical protein LCH85_18845 [Chloroflexi bacterium]|nr:hypothetical protein [Chloroflexota bacterium]
MMDKLPHTFYRRRFVDGRHHVFHSYGFGRVVRNDAELLVYDWSLGTPQRITDTLGWGSDAPRTRLFDQRASRAFGRSWWWRSRPLNITSMYDERGNLIVQRIDFASKAMDISGSFYQTDLYLDCFVAANGITHVVEDEDEVIEAEEVGLLSQAQRVMIETELDTVRNLLRNGTWLSWLEAAAGAPFDRTFLPKARNYDGFWQSRASYWPED